MTDERPTKRRGPIGWLAARTWQFWTVAALIPVFYVASAGPASTFLIRLSVAIGDTTNRLYVDYDYWTPTYAPLVWLATHNDACHAALIGYRDLFPPTIHTRPSAF